MPFLAKEHVPIPTKDLLSWYFDEPKFDQDKPVYIDAVNPSRSYSANQCKRIFRQLAAGFTAAGLKPGDCLNYPILVNGIVAFGGAFAGASPAYQSYELMHQFKTARVQMVIASPEFLAQSCAAADAVGLPRARVLVFDSPGEAVPDGFQSWRSLLEHGERDWVRFDDKATAESTTATLLFSSGTTGLPKAGVLTHANLVAEHTMVHDWKPKSYKASRLAALPMFHASIVPHVHFSPLRSGAPNYILRRFELEQFLSCVERYGVTELGIVPPIVISIIMSPITSKYSLKSVVWASCGAAPLDKGPQARLRALLSPDATFTQVWGMTETSCIASMLHHPADDDTGSVGWMLPGVDAKLVDDDGKDVTDYGVRGELCVRGPIVISGYFENPEANRRDWDDEGYFHTGDIAYCSKERGLWYIVDRKKELIKVRGFQVAPPELEAVLLSHPHIVDAAVIGVKFSRDESELPRAYVVRRPGAQGDALQVDDVKTYLAERLASYKRLEGGVIFLDVIPKNPSGKILKRLLREQVAKEMGAKL